MRGNLAELAATGLASEPTLRKWIDAEPDQPWIIKRGSNGSAYEIDFEGAVAAWRAKEEAATAIARERANQVRQFAMDLGIGGREDAGTAELSIAERKQLLEEEVVAIKLARMRQDLIRYDEVRAGFGDVLVRFSQRGRSFMARLAKRVDLTREQIVAGERMMEADLADLAKMLETLETEIGDASDDGDGAAAAVDDPAAPDLARRRREPRAPAQAA